MLFVELIRTIAPIPRFKKIREAGIIFILFAVTGCSPEVDYDQCVLDAAESGKSEYATQLIVAVCDRREAERIASEAKEKNDACYDAIKKKFDNRISAELGISTRGENRARFANPENTTGEDYLSRVDFSLVYLHPHKERFNIILKGYKDRQNNNGEICNIKDFNKYVLDIHKYIQDDLEIYLYGEALGDGYAVVDEDEAHAYNWFQK